MQERIQKIISAHGLMSRRAAEQAITDGRVSVNGETAFLGQKADDELDDIRVDGKALLEKEEPVYIALNKPKGYVTTLSDEKGRKNVSELVADAGVRVYPVGRLDINSEGLLIMTNDGEFANRLMHPSGNVYKTYKTWVVGEVVEESLLRLKEPFELDECTVQAKNVKVLAANEKSAVLFMTIGEGRNRQVRRMCEIAGLKVTRLCRVKEGSLELGSLKPGEWRYLTEIEVDALYGKQNENGKL